MKIFFEPFPYEKGSCGKGMGISMRGRTKEYLKVKSMAALFLACLMICLAGCGGESVNRMSDMKSQSSASASQGGEISEGGAETGAANSIGDSAVRSNRKLIRTVNMNIETKEFDVLLDSIQEQVKALDGYIENMNTYNGSGYSGYRGRRSAEMTVRIPAEQLDTFLNAITGISNVVRRSDNVEDITLTYVDLESHKKALETEHDRLLELLERAETLEDIITLESRLSDIRYQMESMEAQLRTYDNKVDYSTVCLDVDEVEVLTPVQEKTTWERIGSGFVDSLKNIGDGLVEFMVLVLINLPYLILLAIVVTVIVLVIRLLIKQGDKKRRKQAEERARQQAQLQARQMQIFQQAQQAAQQESVDKERDTDERKSGI